MKILAGFVLLVNILLVGCASPATVEGMTPYVGDVEHTNVHEKLVLGTVIGGRKTSKYRFSNIGSADFREALRRSLVISDLMAKKQDKADYKLDAFVLKITPPSFWAKFSVGVKVLYKITGGPRPINKVIETHGTAGFNPPTYGAARLRVSKERAAKKNISTFIEWWASYDDKTTAVTKR